MPQKIDQDTPLFRCKRVGCKYFVEHAEADQHRRRHFGVQCRRVAVLRTADMLRSTNLGIGAIAVGYKSAAALSRAFQKNFRIAPGRYRRQSRVEGTAAERPEKERAEALMRKAGSHLYIFPNFIYVGSHFRIVTPIRVDETEEQLFPFC